MPSLLDLGRTSCTEDDGCDVTIETFMACYSCNSTKITKSYQNVRKNLKTKTSQKVNILVRIDFRGDSLFMTKSAISSMRARSARAYV